MRALLIRLLLPLVWRLSRRKAVEGLQRFSATELDSAWQSLHAMNAAAEPSLRAKLFAHALEEFGHARLFAQAAKSLSQALPALVVGERRPLLDAAQGSRGLVSFYAYEALAEASVSREFASYLAAAPYEEARRAFRLALGDEKRHASYTARTLSALAGADAARLELRRARVRRLYESWLRLGRGLGEALYSLLLSLLYFLAGPFLAGPCRRRLSMGNRAPRA